MALLIAVAACGGQKAPARTDNNIFGLATRHGVCAKPQLAQKLNVPSTQSLRIVPPYADFQGDNSGLESARFKGSAEVVIDGKLVTIDDVAQLTPCAPDDRMQCTTGAGFADFGVGTASPPPSSSPFAGVNQNEEVEVHVPWRFRNHSETWVTLRSRGVAAINAPIAHCER